MLRPALVAALVVASPLHASPLPSGPQALSLNLVGRYETGVFDGEAAKNLAHDKASQRIFVSNASTNTLDVIDVADPASPLLVQSVDLTSHGAVVEHVAASHGLIAAVLSAGLEADPARTAPGTLVLLDASGSVLETAPTGSTPVWAEFTPDGRTLLVANEAEPNIDYSIDPEGSVSIYELAPGPGGARIVRTRTAGFATLPPGAVESGIRHYGPGASLAQDLEPSSITTSPDGRRAWVTLQENNAIAELDVLRGQFTAVRALGYKDHSLPGNGLDPSDRDGGIRIANWPVLGMYQPDAMDSFESQGRTYIVTANEGDVREYLTFAEEIRVGSGSYVLDPSVFPNASTLKQNANLGRLNVSRATGDTDGDGMFEEIHLFGGRSFSIWSEDGRLVFDSGDQFEQVTAALAPAHFNASDDSNAFDSRSDNKGPEPEGIAVGRIRGRDYAFIALERTGGIMVYDVTVPESARFVQWVNTRDFTQAPDSGLAGELGPRGMAFVPASDSPVAGRALLIVANEVSGSTAIFTVDAAPGIGPRGLNLKARGERR